MEPVEVELVGRATGVRVKLPGACLILAVGSRGYVMCGYLNMETAEEKGDAAAVVIGVSSFSDLLSAGVVSVSSRAREFGVREGMSGRDALELLS